nr:unnamed protein product [Callosobruchus chinensis]
MLDQSSYLQLFVRNTGLSPIDESRKESAQTDMGSMVPRMFVQHSKVIDVHPGKDVVVRVGSLKTSKGVIRRAVATVCRLPSQENVS